MQPACAAVRVKYIAVPKWPELRTATAPMPCALARRSPRPSRPAPRPVPCRRCHPSWQIAPSPPSMSGVAAPSIAPLFSRAAYQNSRITPCDWCPHRSACTSVSATRSACRPRHAHRAVTAAREVRASRHGRRGPAPGSALLGQDRARSRRWRPACGWHRPRRRSRRCAGPRWPTGSGTGAVPRRASQMTSPACASLRWPSISTVARPRTISTLSSQL